MDERTLCKEILNDASSAPKLTLLSALKSYDKVLESHKILQNSQLATDIYRILLRWGRDNEHSWWEKYAIEFEGRDKQVDGHLTLGDLDSARSNTENLKSSAKQDPPSFDEKYATLFLSTVRQPLQESTRNLQHSPPTKGSPLGKFKITLPRFSSQKMLEYPENELQDSLSEAFRDQTLKRKAFELLESNKRDNLREKLEQSLRESIEEAIIQKREDKHKEEAAYEALLDGRADAHNRRLKHHRGFHTWSQFTLISYKRKLTEALAQRQFLKKFMKGLKQVLKIHRGKQAKLNSAWKARRAWLWKKGVLGLVQNVNEQMQQKHKFNNALVSRCEGIRKAVLNCWLRYVVMRKQAKMLHFRGYEASLNLGVKRAFRYLKSNVEVRRHLYACNKKASAFYRRNHLGEAFEYLDQGVLAIKKRASEVALAERFYEVNSKRAVLNVLLAATSTLRSHRALALKSFELHKLKTVIKAWKVLSQRSVLVELTPMFVTSAYAWFCRYMKDESLTDRGQALSLHTPFKVAKPAFYTSANAAFQATVARNIIGSWHQQTRIFRHKHKHWRLKILKPVLQAWGQTTFRRTWTKYVCEKHLNEKQTMVKGNVLINWQYRAHQGRLLKERYNAKLKQDRREFGKTAFNTWLNKYLVIRKLKDTEELTQIQRTQKLVKKHWSLWLDRYRLIEKKKLLSHSAQKFQFNKGLAKHWGIWRKQFLHVVKLNIRESRLVTTKQASFMGKLLRSWHSVTKELGAKAERSDGARVHFYRKLATKALDSLKKSAKLQHYKVMYNEKLGRVSQISLMRRSLIALKLFQQFKTNRKLKDSIVVPQIYAARKQILFKKWYTQAFRLNSARYMGQVLIKSQLKHVLGKLNENLNLHKLTVTFLEVHREQALMKSCLSSLKRHIYKKAELRTLAVQFRMTKRYFSYLKPFNQWRRAYIHNSKGLFWYANAVIVIARNYKRSVFDSWKLYTDKRVRNKCCHAQRNYILGKQSLQAWNKVAGKKVMLERLQQDYAEANTRTSKQTIFYTWLHSAIKRQSAVESAKQVALNIARSFFEKWQQAYQEKQETKEKLAMFHRVQQKLHQMRFLSKLKGKLHDSRTEKANMQLAQEKHVQTLKVKYFAHWTETAHVSSLNTSLADKISYKIERRVAVKAFSHWLELSRPRILKVRATTTLDYYAARCQALHAVAAIKSRIDDQKKQEKVEAEFTEFSRDKLKLRTLKCLGKYMKMRKSEDDDLKRKVFIVFKSKQQRLKSYQQISSKIQSIRSASVARAMLSAWFRSASRSSQLKQRIETFKKVKLITIAPTVYEAFRDNARLRKEASENAVKAASHYDTVLSYKIILSLRQNSIKSQEAKNLKLKADSHYAYRQLYQATVGWSAYVTRRSLKHTQDAEICLTLQAARTARVLTQTFNRLEEYARMTKETVVRAWASLRKSSCRRVLQAWLNVSRVKANLALKQKVLAAKHDERLLGTYFKTWGTNLKIEQATKAIQVRSNANTLAKYLEQWRLALRIRNLSFNTSLRVAKKCLYALRLYSARTSHATFKLQMLKNKLERITFKEVWNAWAARQHKASKAKRFCNSRLTRKVKAWFRNTRQLTKTRRLGDALAHKHKMNEKRSIFELMKTAFEKSFTRGRKLSLCLNNLRYRALSHALTNWKDSSEEAGLEELCDIKLVYPKEQKKLSMVLFAWKYYVTRKLMLDSALVKYSDVKEEDLKRRVLLALKAQVKPVPESLLIKKRKKLVRAWHRLASSQKLLQSSQSLHSSKASKHMKNKYMKLWLKRLRTKLAGYEITTKVSTRIATKAFYRWLFLSKHRSKSEIILLRLHQTASSLLKSSMRRWKDCLALEKEKEDLASSQFLTKQAKNAKLFLSTLSRKVNLKKLDKEAQERYQIAVSLKGFDMLYRATQTSIERKEVKQGATEKYKQVLKFKSLVGWQLWLRDRHQTLTKISDNETLAFHHYNRELLSKCFFGWFEEAQENSVKKARSLLHNILSALRIYTRQRRLLKQYLEESNMSPALLETSREAPVGPQLTLRSLSSAESI
mmetsp:Transcript_9627/g.18762  ORF Transcript_9627/g.18762 Transcript_9627/m.18762 type:complete len:2034 (-) Transcript_9627:101-6202(-)